MKLPRILLLITATALGGCAVNQQEEVDRYRRILDAGLPEAKQVGPDEPLELPRALLLANRADEALAERGELYVQSLIDKNRVVAAFLPTVSLQPAYTVQQVATGQAAGALGVTSTVTGFQVSGQHQTRFEAPVVGSMNLFRGGADIANLRSANATIEQRRQLLLDLQATELLNVALTYYQVLRSEGQVLVLRHSLVLQNERLSDVQQQLKNGLATRLAELQSIALVDATRVSLVQAESDVRNGRSTLAWLIGAPRVDGPLIDNFPVPAQRPDRDAFMRLALATRQDLRAAEAALEAARGSVDAAIAEYYPSVSLNISGFLYREYFSDASKWAAILSANLPIFSAGIIEADVRDAWSRLRIAALAESATRRGIIHDVEIAYENLATAETRIAELKGEVEAAEEALRQAKNQFRNQLAINLDVVAAENELLNAQLLLTGANFDRVVFYLNLLRTAGTLREQVLEHPSPTTRPTTLPATQLFLATQP